MSNRSGLQFSVMLFGLFCALSVKTSVAEDQGSINYLVDIKPVLKERCFACHGTLKQEADLRLDTVLAMRTNGILGKDSTLLMRITSLEHDVRMPPEGEPLKAHEIMAIRKWIADGAVGPDDEQPEATPESHWAFQTIKRPANGLPKGDMNWIDAYFDARYKTAGLVPQPAAERTILLRRLYLDLTGLPPTVEQLASKETLPILIAKLLESPQYGERWGRHWMDVWRYSDWYGLGDEVRDSQLHLWRWRDWIVNSLNENKGYDQMLREMLAGDELAPDDPNVLVATGFLARNWFKFNRTSWLDNTIEHTAKAFMGLTINCAKCHDHKYDPVTHVDYYRFRAIFEPHHVRIDAVPGESDLKKHGITRVFDGNLGAATYLHVRGEESKPDKSQRINAGPPVFLANAAWQPAKPIDLPLIAWRPDVQSFVQEDHLERALDSLVQAEAKLKEVKLELAALDKNHGAGNEKPTEIQVPAKVVFMDDFSKQRPELWDSVGDDLTYQDGHLSVTKPSLEKSFLRSKVKHPRDFELNLKFKTNGGVKWKSVGIRFDVDQSGNNSHFVYASAADGGKVHLAQTVGGVAKYTNAVSKLPIHLNREYTLNLKVRDRLINVTLNGQFLFAFEMPPRQPGAIQLMAYDAIAEFDKIEVRHLPAGIVLKRTAVNPMNMATPGLVKLAEAKRDLAKAEYAFLQARIAADNASLKGAGQGSEEDARRILLEVKIAQAKVDLLDEKTAGKAAEAIRKLEADRESRSYPDYPPLTASSVSLLITKNEDALPTADGYPSSSSGRRTALADWLTHPDHPLTARVAVNHIWLRHFGTPLVASATDFGLRAPAPLHQSLLDYLSVELIESGWDMKSLHHLILSSKTWQRSSSNLGVDQNTQILDGGNRNYWRMNGRRMEAQVIRDSLLYMGETLDLTLGGPPVMASSDARRRSLYFFHSRDSRSKFLTTFDDADVFACYRRSESIVPQQALAMMNSPLATAAAKQIATTFHADLTQEEFVRAAFLKVLGRQPNDSELTVSLTYLKEKAAPEYFIAALINLNDFVMIR
ncbi:MAG: DUF1553 domain-containing protein [Planctomycetaceae bacterium]|nr:DUF1553 domain-containing protein [Planctomycetaceae bacterium]